MLGQTGALGGTDPRHMGRTNAFLLDFIRSQLREERKHHLLRAVEVRDGRSSQRPGYRETEGKVFDCNKEVGGSLLQRSRGTSRWKVGAPAAPQVTGDNEEQGALAFVPPIK